jgi:hypothetical protein
MYMRGGNLLSATCCGQGGWGEYGKSVVLADQVGLKLDEHGSYLLPCRVQTPRSGLHNTFHLVL